MSNPPSIHEGARSTLESLSRFWQFKRKKLAAELQSHLDNTQSQLDTLFSGNQQLTTLCTSQSDEIGNLKLRNGSLVDALQLETANLASTVEALALEKGKLQKAMLALAQTKVYAKDLEERQALASAQIAGLEEQLADHKQQVAKKEQCIGDLERTLTETQQQFVELSEAKEVLAGQCAEQAEQILTLESGNEILSNQLQAEQANAAELELRKAQALAEISTLQEQLADRKKALAENEQRIAELGHTLSDTKQQIEALNDAKQQLAEQCTVQATQISSLESENEVVTTQLQAERANAAELAERKAQALAQITELETYLEEHKNQLLSTEQNVNLLESLAEQLKASQQHLEDSFADINKEHLSLTEKFSLVSKVLAQQPPGNDELSKFADLINRDYMEFASRESSLAGEAQAVLDMQAILAELQMLNNFPSIAGKTILSIAGGFSSGKSAFVNSFIRNPSVKLATGINPVTVVPSYVVCSEETRIRGYSYNGGAIDLEPSLYASMSHEYVQAFGFDLRRILPFISVKVPMDPELFSNLCIIDTPGYNPGTVGGAAASDRNTAASLVNQASALVWVIGLDPAGTIDQSDIEFIESTPFRGESLYVVLNKADVKSQDDILEIMDQVADDLSFAGIEYAGMCAYSSTRKKDYPSNGLTFDQFLRSINRKVDVVGKVNSKLDAVFDAYKQAILADIAELEGRKREFENFKLDALEIGGTALFDRIDRAFPISEQMFESSGLEKLLNECEELRRKLKLAARKALETCKLARTKTSVAPDEFLRTRIRR